MGFLRGNLFAILLVGAVVIGGGLEGAFYVITNKKVDERIDKYNSVAKRLKQLSKNEKVSPDLVKAEEQDAYRLKNASAAVCDEFEQFNRRNYHVLEFPITDERGEETGRMKAFPIDRAVYQKRGAILPFTRQYRKELTDILSSLDPTSPPSEQEIEGEKARLQRVQELKRAADEKRRRTEEPKETEKSERKVSPRAAPSPRGDMDEEMRRAMEEEMAMMSRGRGGRGGRRGRGERTRRPTRGRDRRRASAGVALSQEDVDKARRTVQVRKAEAGKIYAGMEAFSVVFAGGSVTKASDEELWQAQLHLWVTRDVVEAIRQTNEEVLASLPENKRNVLYSPIKRLVSVNVASKYYTGGQLDGSTRSAASDDMDERVMREMEMSRGRGRGRGRSSRSAKKKTNVEVVAPTLTQRASSDLYDLIHYDVTVVMPSRYLPSLLEKLYQQNYHTVIRYSIGSDSDTAKNSGTDEALYLYGVDPTVRVTLKCELAMLASWTRGKWDKKAKAWDPQYPPLMPNSVLKKLGDELPSALRGEDKTRLSPSKKEDDKKPSRRRARR